MSKSPKNNIPEFGGRFSDFQPKPPKSAWNGIAQKSVVTQGEFSTIVGNIESQPPAHVWENIVGILYPKRKRKFAYWWFTGTAAAIIILIISSQFVTNLSNRSIQTYSSSEFINGSPNIKIYESDVLISLLENVMIKKGNISTSVDLKTLSNSSNSDLQENNSNPLIHFQESNPTIQLGQNHQKFTGRAAKSLSVDSSIQNPSRVPIYMLKQKSVTNYSPLIAGNLGTSATAIGKKEIQNYDINNSVHQGFADQILSNESQTSSPYNSRPPITIGLNFVKPLSKRVSLSTGTEYTLGISTISDGLNNYFRNSHYIGVPIGVNIKIKSSKKLIVSMPFTLNTDFKFLESFSSDITGYERSSNYSFRPNFGISSGIQFGYQLNQRFSITSNLQAKYYHTGDPYLGSQMIWPSFRIGVDYILK